MSKRNARARRRAQSTTIRIVNGSPPAGVMTCLRCGRTNVNEDWLVITVERDWLGPDDIGLCERCVYLTFGPAAFKDAALLTKARLMAAGEAS
jgi:hypothetical protein